MSKKVLQFAQKINSERWVQFQILPMRPSVRPDLPPMYLIDVQGQRGDGLVFTVTTQIDKQKIDLAPVDKVITITAALLNASVKQLMTFTGCGCTKETECEAHKRPSGSPSGA